MEKLNDYQAIYNLLITLNSERYIDSANFSSEILENELGESILDVTRKQRHDFVEYKLNPPSFIVIFYYYIYFFRRVPTQQQFLSFYHEINSAWVNINVKKELMDAFNGRLSRTYPSLVRDTHCYMLLKESKKFKRVIYKMKYDLSGKVDIFVESMNNNWYGLQLRVDTKNSDEFYKKKPFRNAIDIPALKNMIDMPLNLDNAKTVYTKKNDLKLYSNRDLEWLTSLINKIENTNLVY